MQPGVRGPGANPAGAGRPARARTSWGGWIRRHRRGLAAGSSAVAVLCLGMALRPPEPAMREVVVLTRDLATGHRLEAADLALARVPAAILAPGSTADPADVAGSVLAAPGLRGEPVSTARLVGSLAGLAAPTGTVPVPVRFADPAAVGLLSAGMWVEVLAARGVAGEDLGALAPPTPARVLSSRALVLAVPRDSPEDQGLLSADRASGAAPLVVLALTPAEARAVAGAEAGMRLSYTMAPST